MEWVGVSMVEHVAAEDCPRIRGNEESSRKATALKDSRDIMRCRAQEDEWNSYGTRDKEKQLRSRLHREVKESRSSYSKSQIGQSTMNGPITKYVNPRREIAPP